MLCSIYLGCGEHTSCRLLRRQFACCLAYLQEVLNEIRELVESEQLRMRRIEHVFELSQIGNALAQSATGRTVGKIAIRCSGEPGLALASRL